MILRAQIELSKFCCIMRQRAGGQIYWVSQPLDLKGVVAAEFAGKAIAAGGFEAEAAVVGWLAQDDDEAAVHFLAARQTRADEGGADATVLAGRQNGDWSEAEAGRDDTAIPFDRCRAEENVAHDLIRALIIGNSHQRDGIPAARDQQPYKPGFQVSRESGPMDGHDGRQVGWLGCTDFIH